MGMANSSSNSGLKFDRDLHPPMGMLAGKINGPPGMSEIVGFMDPASVSAQIQLRPGMLQ